MCECVLGTIVYVCQCMHSWCVHVLDLVSRTRMKKDPWEIGLQLYKIVSFCAVEQPATKIAKAETAVRRGSLYHLKCYKTFSCCP